MALDKTRLGTAIATAVAALAPEPDATVDLNAVWIAVADELIKEIQGNMEIATDLGETGAGPAGGPLPVPPLTGSAT